AEACLCFGAEHGNVRDDRGVEAAFAKAQRTGAEPREAVTLGSAARARRGCIEYPQRAAALEEPVADVFVGGAAEENASVLEQLAEYGGYNLRRVVATLSVRGAHRLRGRPVHRLAASHYILRLDHGSIDSPIAPVAVHTSGWHLRRMGLLHWLHGATTRGRRTTSGAERGGID